MKGLLLFLLINPTQGFAGDTKKTLTLFESAVHCESRGDRTRTCDSLVPNQERYQLRYTSVILAMSTIQNFVSEVPGAPFYFIPLYKDT